MSNTFSRYGVAFAALFATSVLVSCNAPESVEPEISETTGLPNIIVILADDIGIETVGTYGSEYPTPNIDSIAENGMRLDAAHATPICTPSRVRLLTGRYNYKNYVDFAVLDPGEKTMAHYLKDAGYRTLVSGKWQLAGTKDADDPPGTTPGEAGFDEHLVWYMQRKDKGSRFWGPKLFDNGEVRQHEESDYGPTIINQRVLDFIAADDERPFFVFYTMMLAHKPWVTTPVSLEAESNKERFTGMMAYMDQMVGNVLQEVREQGLEDNTLIFFIGDNGTHPDITSLRNGVPVRGGKWYTHDAATHVPFLVQWPGKVPAGSSSGELVDLMDVLPTVLDVAEIETPEQADGYNLAPLVNKNGKTGREWIFMKFDPHADYVESLSTRSRFIFDHDWKLYGDGRFFQLQDDFLEQNPLDTDNLDTSAADAYRKLSVIMESIDDGPFFHDQPGPDLPEH